jgi:hypothetical protein
MAARFTSLDGGAGPAIDGVSPDDRIFTFGPNGKTLVVGRRSAGGGEFARDGKAWVYSLRVASAELYLVDGLK